MRFMRRRCRIIFRHAPSGRVERGSFDLDQGRRGAPIQTRAQGGDAMARTARDYGIPGTPIFDGAQAQKGYALNKMCYSFNSAENREAFKRDEEAYCAKYGLDAAQRSAIRNRNVLELIAAGGNVYYLAKFAGIFGLNVQDIGAQQTGVTVEQFRQKLLDAAR
jgi:protocatechuate 4,5-dioxygenase alpha chain